MPIGDGTGGRGVGPAKGASLGIQILTWTVAPFVAAYLIAKWALRGLLRGILDGLGFVPRGIKAVGRLGHELMTRVRAVASLVNMALRAVASTAAAVWRRIGVVAA